MRLADHLHTTSGSGLGEIEEGSLTPLLFCPPERCWVSSADAATSPVPTGCGWRRRLRSLRVAHQNDEVLLVIRSPQVAAHFSREMDRLWRSADLGITERLRRKLERNRQRCGSGIERD